MPEAFGIEIGIKTWLRGLQALAEASDRLVAARAGERRCGLQTHEELKGACPRCRAQV